MRFLVLDGNVFSGSSIWVTNKQELIARVLKSSGL